MNIETVINRAMEAGYKHPEYLDFEQIDWSKEEVMFWGDGTQTDRISIYKIFHDRLFWQALSNGNNFRKNFQSSTDKTPEWVFFWHLFIDHLIAGKDIQDFFTEYITKQ